jgi:MFS family permease
LMQLLPVTVLGLFVGTLIDRLEVRRIALACEVMQLGVAAALAVLALSHVIAVWQIYLLAVLQGILQAVGGPARHALVFQMVGREDLANAIALNSSLGTTARVVGPAVGGAIVRSRGPASPSRSTREASSRSCSPCSRSTCRSCTTRSATTARRWSAAPSTRCASSCTTPAPASRSSASSCSRRSAST